MKFVSVATSRKYVVAPVEVSQCAVNDVCVMFVAGVARGGSGVATTVVNVMLLELGLGPPALDALTRYQYVVDGESPVTFHVRTLPTLMLLYPVTISLNIESVATTRMYDVAVDAAFQLAVNDVWAMFVAGVATGAGGGNICETAPATARQYARASSATALGIVIPFMYVISNPFESRGFEDSCDLPERDAWFWHISGKNARY